MHKENASTELRPTTWHKKYRSYSTMVNNLYGKMKIIISKRDFHDIVQRLVHM